MPRTDALTRMIFAALALLVLSGCDTKPRRHESVNDVPLGTFTAPSEWSFPAGSIPPVLGRDGMVTTTDRVATEIGVEILRRGGNAADAAVATHFALAVVNPEAGNIGGGGFLVVRLADGETAALDFREKAPLTATSDMFLDSRRNVSEASTSGHRSAGVPGSVAGMWEVHQRFGSLAWSELLQPAINLARGMVLHERLAISINEHAERLKQHPATAEIFLPEGSAPRVGDRLVQSDLAETLRRIASEGATGFYHGRTALLIAQEMQKGGGLITREDLAAYRAVWREPILFRYREHEIVSMPPPSSGGAALAEILNILEGYDLAALDHHSAEHAHLWAEAVKRAYADRNAYLADPDFVEQPVATMISDDYAGERREEIDPTRAAPSDSVSPGLGPVPGPREVTTESEHTTHYSIIDGEGNAVAVTTTINSLYGNLITVSGAGFLLNNEMDDFTSKPGEPNQFGLVQGHANVIAPGKRMLSGMTPTIVVAPDGQLKLVTGTPGGSTIITSVAQVVSNAIDFKMGVGNMTAAPRLHHQHLPDVLRYEQAGVASDTAAALRRLGHEVEERPGYQGDTQTIEVLADGTLAGVADPRRGGAALGVRAARDVVQ